MLKVNVLNQSEMKVLPRCKRKVNQSEKLNFKVSNQCSSIGDIKLQNWLKKTKAFSDEMWSQLINSLAFLSVFRKCHVSISKEWSQS